MNEPGALRRRATLILFASFVFLVPAPFYLLFIAGLIPLVLATLYFAAAGAAGLAQGQSYLLLFAALVLAVHLIINGAVLYLAALGICRLLFRFLAARRAALAVGLVIAVELALSFFPIYWVPANNGGFESVSLLWFVRYLVPGYD